MYFKPLGLVDGANIIELGNSNLSTESRTVSGSSLRSKFIPDPTLSWPSFLSLQGKQLNIWCVWSCYLLGLELHFVFGQPSFLSTDIRGKIIYASSHCKLSVHRSQKGHPAQSFEKEMHEQMFFFSFSLICDQDLVYKLLEFLLEAKCVQPQHTLVQSNKKILAPLESNFVQNFTHKVLEGVK